MIRDSILPEFDAEMVTTRQFLEIVPDEHLSWKPHTKSYTLGDLAMHIARLPTWAVKTLTETEFDMRPTDGLGFNPVRFGKTADIVAFFGSYRQTARAVLMTTSNEAFMVPWTLKNGGTVMFTRPRVDVFRTFFLNHVIHHRGQLSVYLRLLDVPLPQIYGPTADNP